MKSWLAGWWGQSPLVGHLALLPFVIIYHPGLEHDLPSSLNFTARSPKQCHLADASPILCRYNQMPMCELRCFTPRKQTVFSDRSEAGLLLQWFSNFSLHQNGAEGVVNRPLAALPGGLGRAGWGPALCISVSQVTALLLGSGTHGGPTMYSRPSPG